MNDVHDMAIMQLSKNVDAKRGLEQGIKAGARCVESAPASNFLFLIPLPHSAPFAMSVSSTQYPMVVQTRDMQSLFHVSNTNMVSRPPPVVSHLMICFRTLGNDL